MYEWNAADYARNSQGQQQWARELLGDVQLAADEQVLDIGCGDGRTTAAIAMQVPSGRVLGVDLSDDMVAYARQQFADIKNLSFAQANASSLHFSEQFTLVFSNAALHWVSDHQPLLAGIYRALRNGGQFIAQMGGFGNGAEMIASFEAVMALPQWRAYFINFKSGYGFHHPDDYSQWLQALGFSISQCKLIIKDMVHLDATAFAGWIRTAWLPYTNPIPASQRAQFIAAAVEHYLSAHPADDAGHVHVQMVRLQVRAHKV